MYLLIDNYDSFTYNLYVLFVKAGVTVKVIKNDSPVIDGSFTGIILSPGPSRPENSGNTLKYIKEYAGRIPIFGVCLGMQAICFSLGYPVRKAVTIRHGKLDKIKRIRESTLLNGLPDIFESVRYHSLVADVSDDIAIAVSSYDNELMAMECIKKKLFGVQFHPESYLSQYGLKIVQNYITFCEDNNNG